MLLSQAPLPEKLLRIEDLGVEVALLAVESRQRRRISVRPGLTCVWQIRGRSRIQFAEWVNLDLHLERRTLALDLWIVLCTPLAVLRRDGAS